MSDRFDKLKKIPDHPAARFLAAGNAKLKTKSALPASASVPEVLAELEAAGALVDMIRLLSVALPPREVVWWACIAGRDMLSEDVKDTCVKAAEAWVLEPSEANRDKVRVAMESADQGDPTALVPTAAFYAPGNLGSDYEMKDQPAPEGIVGVCAFGANLKTLKLDKDPDARMQLIIDRALDIARGGNGKIAPSEPIETAEVQKGAA